eukprot:358192-Chlamydomonas_euryale.AAC.22
MGAPCATVLAGTSACVFGRAGAASGSTGVVGADTADTASVALDGSEGRSAMSSSTLAPAPFSDASGGADSACCG